MVRSRQVGKTWDGRSIFDSDLRGLSRSEQAAVKRGASVEQAKAATAQKLQAQSDRAMWAASRGNVKGASKTDTENIKQQTQNLVQQYNINQNSSDGISNQIAKQNLEASQPQNKTVRLNESLSVGDSTRGEYSSPQTKIPKSASYAVLNPQGTILRTEKSQAVLNPQGVTVEQTKSKVLPQEKQGPKNLNSFERALDSTGKWFDKTASSPLLRNPVTATFIAGPYTAVREGVALTSSIINLGKAWDALAYDKSSPTVTVPKTIIGEAVSGGIDTMSIEGAGQAGYEQAKRQGGYVTTQEAAITLAGIPFRALNPLKLQPITVPTAKGTTTIGKSLVLTAKDKSKILISKTDESFNLGKPKFQDKITVEAFTPKQQQRGVKLAADNSRLEQMVMTSPDFVKRVKGIDQASVQRAENIKNIIDIGSKSKDPIKADFLAKQFEKIEQAEQPSLLKSIKSQQSEGILKKKLGPVEGSLSQNPFLSQGKRIAGDYDFNMPDFKKAKEAAQRTAKDFSPSEKEREMLAIISEKNKSAKNYIQGEKVGEFLNPQETSKEGIEQVIEGSTVWGKTLPKQQLKTPETEIKTFNLQRQFVKKGESLFSLQKTREGLELGPAEFRKKDIGDFYTIAKEKEINLRAAGKIKEADSLAKELDIFKSKSFKGYDFDSARAGGRLEITSDNSIISRLGDSSSISRASKSLPSISSLTSKSSLSYSLSKSTSSPRVDSSPSALLKKSPAYDIVNGRDSISLTSKKSEMSLSAKSPPVYSTPKKSPGSIGTKSPGYAPKIQSGKTSGSKGSRLSYSKLNTQALEQQEKIKRGVIIPWKSTISEGKPQPRKPRADFIGTSSEIKIAGYYKRQDITYGRKKVERLKDEDFRKQTRKINLGSKPRTFTGKKTRLKVF